MTAANGQEGTDVEWDWFKQGWNLDFHWLDSERDHGYGAFKMAGYHAISPDLKAKVTFHYTRAYRKDLGGGCFEVRVAFINKNAGTIDAHSPKVKDKPWWTFSDDEMTSIRHAVEDLIAVYAG